MTYKGWIAFFRATCISWGMFNLLFLFIFILIMWIEGALGYYFIPPIVFLTLIYSILIYKIVMDVKIEVLSIWKLIAIGFLMFVSYQNYDFAHTVIQNNGRYPCAYGANCP